MMGETSDESRNDEDDVLARKLEAVVWTFAKWPASGFGSRWAFGAAPTVTCTAR